MRPVTRLSAEPIVPARLAFADGAPVSADYGDVYFSREGGAAETRHVFLAGNGLPGRWQGRRTFIIVETGFGTGLNFFVTWAAWRATAAPDARLHFVSVEKHPLRREDLARLFAESEFAPLAAELLAQYPPFLPGFHRLHLDGGRVTLTLLLGDAAAQLVQVEGRADAFFLDGFSPARNPAMWTSALFAALARLAAPGATLATFTVAGEVRRGLAEAGFTVEKRPGFGTKREMLVATHPGSPAAAEAPEGAHALVLGAGLAGACMAERLAARGWTVDVVERHSGPAQESSGNPAGLLLPVLSADWNFLSRFASGGYLYALRRVAALAAEGYPLLWGATGVYQMGKGPEHDARQRRIVAGLALPEDFVRYVEADEGAGLCGQPVAAGGWWFPAAAWARPGTVSAAALDRPGVRVRYGREVAALRREDGVWRALDAAGDEMAAAPVAVLATGNGGQGLPGLDGLPLRAVRGQVSFLPARPGFTVRCGVCREGYVTPEVEGIHCAGASYNEGMTETALRVEDHAANLERLERLFPGAAAGLDPAALAGRVGFRAVSRDRLPLVGPLEGEGLFGILGLGSRGMAFAPLAAELLACRLTGEPWPVERRLAEGVSPGRFKG